MFRRMLKIEMAVEVKPGQGCWEATSMGIDIVAEGQTPDGAVKEFERLLKEGRSESKARKVIQYVPQPKVEEAPVVEESLAGEDVEVKETEEVKEVVFKKRGRPRKVETTEDTTITEVL